MSSEQSLKRRWYDRRPVLSQGVSTLLVMPDEICSIVAEGMTKIMRKEYKEIMQEKHYRTLGSDKVLGLHKSKKKRRATYDNNEALHYAMTYLYILSDTRQDLMAAHILKLLDHIEEYLSTCQEFEQKPNLPDIVQMTKRYIEEGSDEVKAFLKKLRAEFLLGIFKSDAEQDALKEFVEDHSESPLNIVTKGDTQGMRVHKQDL